jgi:hypothetical protein
MTADVKVMTVRLPGDLADDLEMVARVDGVPVVEVIRAAVAAYIAARRADEAFRRRLRDRIEADEGILQRLAAGRLPAGTDGSVPPSGDEINAGGGRR